MSVSMIRVRSGARVGFWNPNPPETHKPFTCAGHYIGPDLGEHLPGARLEQPLMEGNLIFRVGTLFRPDLGKYQRVEGILILETYFPEMFNYEHWQKATG